jgi:GT2 family glycosyltransferase
METSPLVYGVIVTYNGLKWIDKCLLSLSKSSIKVHLVVIDNNSTDSTVDFIKINYPDVVIFSLESNIGFGRANNIGLGYALKEKADFVLLINQDVYIQVDTLKCLLKYNDGNSILSSIHLNGEGTKMDINFKKNSMLSCINNNNDTIDEILIQYNKKIKLQTNFINAAFWLIPVEIINEIGGFNPIFSHYGEDVNYVNRMQFHKKKMYIITQTFIMHDRLQFGNIDVFNQNTIYKELLILLLNNNINFSESLKSLINIFIRFAYYILTFKFAKSLNLILDLFKIARKLPEIFKAKRLEANIGLNWLDNNYKYIKK